MFYDAQHQRIVLFDETDAWSWDGVTWSFQSHAPVTPPERMWETVGYDAARNTVVLFGGAHVQSLADLSGFMLLDDTWVWDGSIWAQQHPATSPPARAVGSMGYDATTGNTVLFGGIFDIHADDLNDTWTWDGSTWTQQHPALSPPARDSADLVYDPATKSLLLFGGQVGFFDGRTISDTWSWDGSAWAEQHPDSSPSEAGLAVAGGAAGAAIVLSRSGPWTWSGATWILSRPTGTPPPRADAAMAYDAARGVVLLFGGRADNGPLNDSWTWDGSAWTEQHPAQSPPPRAIASMAYDAGTGTVVLFGGRAPESPQLGDTWTWDGVTWTERHPARSPSARTSAGIAYDEALGAVILVSGAGAGGTSVLDTWSWDGISWAQLQPANSVPNLYGQTMAYDAAARAFVLTGTPEAPFGGSESRQTWSWDGSTWRQLGQTGGPPGGFGASMSYDQASRTMAFFGGLGSGASTWTWDGSSWTEEYPANSPPSRERASMAFDARRGVLVLFGGDQNPNLLSDTWTWDGGTWTNMTAGANSR